MLTLVFFQTLHLSGPGKQGIENFWQDRLTPTVI